MNTREQEHYETARGLRDGAFSRSEFIGQYHRKYPDRKVGSIIPSDYCVNLCAKGTESYAKFLRWLGPGEYELLDLLQPVNNSVSLEPDILAAVRGPAAAFCSTAPADIPPDAGVPLSIPEIDMPIKRLWECREHEPWRKALKCYWKFVKPQNLELEREFDALELERLRRLDPRSWYDFLHDEYYRWKYTAPNRLATTRARLRWYVENDRLADLDRIRRDLLALDTDDIRGALKLARSIRGLGPAGASGLLAVMHPAKFGTADQFVVKALQNVPNLPEASALARMRPESLTDRNSELIIKILRRKASENNRQFGSRKWTPRKVDMVLWACR